VTAAAKLCGAKSFLRSCNLFQNIMATYHEIETDVRQCGKTRSNLIWQYGGSIFFSDTSYSPYRDISNALNFHECRAVDGVFTYGGGAL